MSARDWNTNRIASTSYSSKGANYFVDYPSLTQNRSQIFTGLMIEWYQVDPGFVEGQPVTYSSTTITLKSAWMWMDE
ncbi:MAG: Zinc ribbon protein [Thermoproteota archaeon]|nr:Zinc ribbon protein [Thermoproteota archaeon]